MTKFGILGLASATFFIGLVFTTSSCSKNPVNPPTHDTVTVVKHDTLYTTKPDSTVNLTKGLLLYLPFSGNIADSSGNGNPTAAVGTVLTADAHGWPNNAFGATGMGEQVVVTNNGSIKFDTAFSVSFGFMSRDTFRTQSFLSMVNPVNGYGASFNLGLTDPISHRFSLGVGDITSSCDAIVSNTVIDTTLFKPLPESWYNCVCIYHKGGVQIYINGVMIASKQSSWTQAIVCPSAKFIVGAWWNGDMLSMNGKLDNIRLYNRVLTPHEIVALSANYQVTSNGLKSGIKTH